MDENFADTIRVKRFKIVSSNLTAALFRYQSKGGSSWDESRVFRVEALTLRGFRVLSNHIFSGK